LIIPPGSGVELELQFEMHILYAIEGFDTPDGSD
jgi:hypothetical protein